MFCLVRSLKGFVVDSTVSDGESRLSIGEGSGGIPTQRFVLIARALSFVLFREWPMESVASKDPSS